MYDRLLVPVDLGDIDSLDKALPVAAALATGTGAEIHVLAVVPTGGMPMVAAYLPDDFAEQAVAEAQALLGDLLGARRDMAGAAALSGHVARGSVYQEIMHVADRLRCDAIVMTAHRPELRDYLLGPNAARVVRHASQSVMVVRG